LTAAQRRILEQLKDVRHSPADVARFLDIKPPTVSKHLKKLRRDGYVVKRRGVKGAGSYVLTEKGRKAVEAQPEQPKQDHQGWLIVKPHSELHKWYADFKVTGAWELPFNWDRSSRPPNDYIHWKDGFKEEDKYGDLLEARRIRYAEGKKSKTITIWLDHQSPVGLQTCADVVSRNTDMALKIAGHIQRTCGVRLGLIGICGRPHVAFNINPDIALTCHKAGIRTEDVYIDFSDGVDQPHLETDNIRKGIMLETAPDHIEHLYESKDVIQRDYVKLYARVAQMERNGQLRDGLIESLFGFVHKTIDSVDRIAAVQLDRDLEIEKAVAELVDKMQRRDKKRPGTDPGDMFR